MIRKLVLTAFVVAAVLMPLRASTQGYFDDSDNGYVQHLANGAINWQTMKLRVAGSGAPNPNAPSVVVARLGAERAALLNAYAQALETLKGVHITAETTVENFVTTSDTIRSRVEGVLRGATVVDRRYLHDTGVEVTIEVPLTGQMAQLLLGDQQFGRQTAGGAMPGTAGPAPAGPVYTGLIIDARGLGAMPAMSPRVYDENGDEVYGTTFVSRDYAIQMGVVGYGKDLEAARANDRVADNPLVIKATSLTGPAGTDLVIPQEQANEIREVSRSLSFLEKCRVMILL